MKRLGIVSNRRRRHEKASVAGWSGWWICVVGVVPEAASGSFSSIQRERLLRQPTTAMRRDPRSLSSTGFKEQKTAKMNAGHPQPNRHIFWWRTGQERWDGLPPGTWSHDICRAVLTKL